MITEFIYREYIDPKKPWLGKTPGIEVCIETINEEFDIATSIDEYRACIPVEVLEEIELSSYEIEYIMVKVDDLWVSFTKDFVLFENGGYDQYPIGIRLDDLFCVLNLGRPLDLCNFEYEIEENLKKQIAFQAGFA